MAKRTHAKQKSDDSESLLPTEANGVIFTLDEPELQATMSSDKPSADNTDEPSGPTDKHSVSTGDDAAEGEVEAYEPRRQTPSHILFLPNMSSRVSEKDLSDFATKLPCQAKKTFVYMSNVACHGFIECLAVEDAIKNLEHINSNNLEVRGRRVIAEYSKRKSVQDRKTYENRQHSRKEREQAEKPRERVERPLRRRSRSRSPPPRSYGRPRSPPREYDRYPPRDRRDDYYRREVRPSEFRRSPPRRFDAPLPESYRREYDDRREYRDYPPRREYENYPESAPYPRSSYEPYPAAPRSYPQPVYPVTAPIRSQSPVGAYASEGYRQPYPPAYQGAAPVPFAAPVSAPATVAHPLLSMRPTAVGTFHPDVRSAPYPQYHQYR